MILLIFSICVLFLLLKRFSERILIPNVESKAVFVTGCDSGFGRLLANRLTSAGVTVFAGCYTQKGEENVQRENGSPSNLFTIRIDVTDEESLEQAYKLVYKTLQSRGQQLWAVVNNAGVFSSYGPDDWLSTKEYKDALDVNFLGSVRICHKFVPLLKKSRGRIVTMVSVSGRVHSLYMGPYTAAKFALEGYMDTIRLELRSFGVTVHILEPGAFLTDLLNEKAFNGRVDSVWDKLSSEVQVEYGSQFKENFKEAWNSGAQLVASRNFHYVVDNYMHALFAAFPRNRYYCGWDALFLWIPLSTMPSVVQDFILHHLYKLQPGPSLIPDVLRKEKIA